MKTINQQLLEARQHQDKSQGEVALASDTQQGDLSKFENSRKDIRLSTLARIANALGMDIVAVPKKYSYKTQELIDPKHEVREISMSDLYGVPDD